MVWFTRTIEAPQGAGEMTLSLGRISNTAEVWVNGLSVAQNSTPPPAAGTAAAPGAGRGAGGRGAAPAAAAPPAGGRGNLPYELPSGTLKPGANTITVRITNNRNDGGFLGTPDTMFAQAGETRIPLAGTWKYRVERQSNAGALYSKPGELAAHVALANSPAPATATLPEPAASRRARRGRSSQRQVRRNAVRQDRADRRAGPAGRDRLHQPGRDAAQLRARSARLAQGDRRRPPTILRGRRTGRRSNTCRRFRRFCSRPSWSNRARRSRCSSRRRPSRGSIHTSARSRDTGA